MPTVDQSWQLIPCGCCGHEILAEWKGSIIVVRSKRHGRIHTAVIHVQDLTKTKVK